MRADTWNAFADAANRKAQPHVAKEAKHQKVAGLQFIGPFVKLDNDAARGMAVAFQGTAFTEASNPNKYLTQPVLDGDYAQDAPGRWGISLGGKLGTPVRLAMAGVVTADLNVPTNGDWIDRAEIDPLDTTRLVSHPGGSAQILEKSGTSGDVKAVVRLGLPQNVTYRGKATAEITNDSSGPVEIWTGAAGTGFSVTAHLGWMNSGATSIVSGDEVLITWFPIEDKWHIVGSQCPPS